MTNSTLAVLQRIHGALAELDPLGRSTDIDDAMDVVYREIVAIAGEAESLRPSYLDPNSTV